MIFNIEKDVTSINVGVMAHGCNCLGAMGSGVARAVRQTWPKAYSEYVRQCRNYNETTRKSLLGTVQIVQVDKEEGLPNLYVANCFTQEKYGSDGKVYADLGAIEEAFNNVIAFALHHDLPLYIPKIGCGLGGLSWEQDVLPLLVEAVDNIDIDVFVCDIK